MPVAVVYAPTDVCEAGKKMFHSKIDSVLDQCLRYGPFIVLGDFNAVTSTEKAESCKIHKVKNCGFSVSETSAALLDLV